MAAYIKGVQRGQSGSFSIDSDSMTMVAIVITDDRYATPDMISRTSGMPTVGGWFDWLGYIRIDLILSSIECEQDSKSPFVWRCTLTYTTSPGGDPNTDPGDQAVRENPLLKAAELDMSSESITRALDKTFSFNSNITTLKGALVTTDTEAAPVCNSAFQKFIDPPLEEEKHIRVYTIKKNITVANQLALENDYADDVINSDPFTLAGRFCDVATIRMPPPNYVLMRGGPTGSYYAATFRLKYKSTTWLREILDRGNRDNAGKPWTEAAVYGNEVHNLDGLGTFLAVGVTPVSLYYQTIKAAPLSPLLSYWSS